MNKSILTALVLSMAISSGAFANNGRELCSGSPNGLGQATSDMMNQVVEETTKKMTPPAISTLNHDGEGSFFVPQGTKFDRFLHHVYGLPGQMKNGLLNLVNKAREAVTVEPAAPNYDGEGSCFVPQGTKFDRFLHHVYGLAGQVKNTAVGLFNKAREAVTVENTKSLGQSAYEFCKNKPLAAISIVLMTPIAYQITKTAAKGIYAKFASKPSSAVDFQSNAHDDRYAA